MNEDSINLLKECDSGTKTAVSSIREVLDNVKSEELLKLLTHSVEEHEKIGNETKKLLQEANEDGKEPPLMAKAMSWMKINVDLLAKPSDKTVADLMTDGCNMGIKSISVYFNKYPNAEQRIKNLVDRIRVEEDDLVQKLRNYL